MSGCLPLEGTENSSSQTKEELNTQNHSSKVIIRPIVRAVDGLGMLMKLRLKARLTVI